MLTELIHHDDCKKNSIVTDPTTGELACSNCGTVLPEKSLEVGLENSSPIEGYSSSRVGSKISLKMADMGLSTIIEAQDKDSTGKLLSKENRRMFYRLRMWDRNSRSANTVKSFQKACTLLDAIGTKLGLPEVVIEQTAYLFRKVSAKKILSGRSTIGVRRVSGSSWTLFVPVQIKVNADLLIAVRPMQQGQMLRAEDIAVQNGDLTHPGTVVDPAQAVGKILKFGIGAGQA